MSDPKKTLKKAFWKAIGPGGDSSPETDKRYRVAFLNAVTLAGGLTLAAFSGISLASGNASLSLATAIAVALVFLNLAAIRAFKKYYASGIFDCALIFALYLYFAVTGGEQGSGILWSMTYPLITLFLLGSVAGSVASIAYGIAIGVVILSPSLNAAGFPLLYSVRVLGVYSFIYLFALIYEIVRSATQARLVGANADLSQVTEELKAEKKQADDILGGVEEGIFLLSRDLRLGESHSSYLERLFGRKDLARTKLMDILGPALGAEDFSAASDYLEMFLLGKLSPQLLSEINPFQEIRCSFPSPDAPQDKHLKISFIRVGDAQAAFPILAVARDVTDEVRLRQRLALEEKEHRRSMESLFQIIHVDPAMLREFVTDTEAEFDSVNELMRREGSSGKEILESLFQSIHAVKGNAILLGLKEFGIKVHEFEGLIKDTMNAGHEWRDLLSLTLGLADLTRELDELKALIGKILAFQRQTEASGLSETSLFQASVEKMVTRESQRAGMPATAEFSGLGKEGVPDEHRRLLKDVLVQLIRNSFAHGFEPQAERRAKGKPEKGRVCVSAERDGESFLLRYRDDGRGLDPQRLRARALAMPELAREAASMEDGDLARLIFKQGFSTSEAEGLGAGRGVGMSLVMSRVSKSGGRLSLRSAKGKYIEFTIKLPLSGAAADPA